METVHLSTDTPTNQFVEFHWGLVKDTFGKVVKDDHGKEVRIPYVTISNPADQTLIIDTPVRDDHKHKWPDRWLSWQMSEGMIDNYDVPGFKIADWDEIDDEQKRELKYLRFSTVEQVAGASDIQVQRMGISGPGLRVRANAFLKSRMDAVLKKELDAKDAEIAALKRADEEKEERLRRLENAMLAAAPAPVAPAPQPEASAAPSAVSAELIAQYQSKFGKPPHHRMSAKTIAEKLAG